MSTDVVLHLDVDPPVELSPQALAQFQAKGVEFFTLETARPIASDWIDAACTLRSANRSFILQLLPCTVSDEERNKAFDWLFAWDQASLGNILALCGAKVPEASRKSLETEARLEDKCLREWISALSDSRIARYPSMPWRRFIRKIVVENVAFGRALMASSDVEAVTAQFLENKRRAISLFPKKKTPVSVDD